MRRRPTWDFIILILALGLEGVVLFFVTPAMARLTLGLFLLIPIVWMSARVGVVDLVHELPSDRVHQRRFGRLRAQVQQLLDEIRRLNWMAVDAERGFRSREKALREMDSIEERLKILIAEIRDTAGQMTERDEAVGQDDEQATSG
jgi:hypothetical protein